MDKEIDRLIKKRDRLMDEVAWRWVRLETEGIKGITDGRDRVPRITQKITG